MSAMRSQAGHRVTDWPCYRRGGPIAVNRARASSSRAAIMSLTSASSGVSARPGPESERPAGPPCRARAVPCPLTSADRDHAASANPARGAGYHALFRALVSLTQDIRLIGRQLDRPPGCLNCPPNWTFCALTRCEDAGSVEGLPTDRGRRYVADRTPGRRPGGAGRAWSGWQAVAAAARIAVARRGEG